MGAWTAGNTQADTASANGAAGPLLIEAKRRCQMPQNNRSVPHRTAALWSLL
jgi:hypothetical protein